MIAYKVIDKKTRYGSNAAMVIKYFGIDKFYEMFDKFPKLKEFFPIYNIGKEIECAKKSVGLMCFEEKEYAESFYDLYNKNNMNIIKVKLNANYIMDDGLILSGCGCDPIKLIEDCIEYDYISTPIGTILTKKLLVLE